MSLAVIGLVISIATLILIDKLVIARMFDLIEVMRQIGARDDLSARVPVTGNDEVSHFAQAINRGLDELEHSEVKLNASLREKEVLLKEIHHRVKNNLQIISSLLSLQSENIGNGSPAEMFRESQDRIRSMALIHEKLYQAQDIARVDFAEYVRSLTSNLVRSYVRGHDIGVNVDIAGVSLGIDTAIPCGLIINELVSNSLKYAFKGSEPGEIRISMSRDDNVYTLTVADNGPGLPAGFDIRETKTLGLQLVATLVDQLEGTLELDSTNGALIRITFPEPVPIAGIRG